MTGPTEKQLDATLETAFRTDPEFTAWFLAKTGFAGHAASYLWSRSNHPWGKVTYVTRNPVTGDEEAVFKECETDVLVVFITDDERRFALHIENKLGSGRFTALQPELYRPRAEQWKGLPKYQNYSEFETVLLAPRRFQERHADQAGHFDRFVSHEEIGRLLPLFAELN